MSQKMAPPLAKPTRSTAGSTQHFGFDQELSKGWIISSPGASKVSLLSPKKSSGANSVGGNYFWPIFFTKMTAIEF